MHKNVLNKVLLYLVSQPNDKLVIASLLKKYGIFSRLFSNI